MKRMFDENEIKNIASEAGSKLYKHTIDVEESELANFTMVVEKW